MATYLDILSAQYSDEYDNENFMQAMHMQQLADILFADKNFVMFIMNWRHSKIADVNLAKRCILHIWHACNGIADITACCRLFAESIDEPCLALPALRQMITDLQAKYDLL